MLQWVGSSGCDGFLVLSSNVRSSRVPTTGEAEATGGIATAKYQGGRSRTVCTAAAIMAIDTPWKKIGAGKKEKAGKKRGAENSRGVRTSRGVKTYGGVGTSNCKKSRKCIGNTEGNIARKMNGIGNKARLKHTLKIRGKGTRGSPDIMAIEALTSTTAIPTSIPTNHPTGRLSWYRT
ncbi:hypothetical protein CMQ_5159 [Grosmannia clavigera kw1407]|uniref:Uncharacterized protein n=1 Tax=Grosmannia clavigera (strain kw1407 / UAMH 11150) TaxID=655863 RepID=F0XBK1_GROCL|nr:uncharacterized protein CMQ_5159 [Grosmannia clavigera kw1407]EFX04897.1 hypothetical protein CMQ_5159 [Grosmannia clavigera kw1407]